MRKDLIAFSKERLLDYIEVLARNWLAHDGCWFLGIEESLGTETAIHYDIKGWERFSVAEAKRLKQFLQLSDHPGIPGLIEALKFRLYANINVQEITDISENSCVFRMNECQVQTARTRKRLPDFPCKKVGLVEYGLFAQIIDDRLETKCICCPPDDHPSTFYCAWKFTLKT